MSTADDYAYLWDGSTDDWALLRTGEPGSETPFNRRTDLKKKVGSPTAAQLARARAIVRGTTSRRPQRK